jgi:anti-sigma factor RsiW
MSVAVLSTFHVHPTEDLLDEYIFGRLQEPALSILEDHLFTCCSCQSTLAELDDYVRAAKIALAELQHASLAPAAAPPAWARLPGNTTAIWALGLVLVLSGSAMIWRRMQTPPETVTATLTAFRGGNAAALMLALIIDTTSLPAARAYRLQIVNASGNNAWSGEAMASGEKLSAHLSKGLGPGVYWVRLYEPQIPGDAGLLREFGLRLE